MPPSLPTNPFHSSHVTTASFVSTPEASTDGGRDATTACATTAPLASLSDIGEADLLVIGSGVAGCSTALKAAELGRSVTMLTAVADPKQCNSFW